MITIEINAMVLISKDFAHAELPNDTQRLLLVLLAILIPPLPIYMLTAPKYSVRTREFWISVLLMFVFNIAAIIYLIWFVVKAFPAAREGGEGNGYFGVVDQEAQAIVDDSAAPTANDNQPKTGGAAVPSAENTEVSPEHDDELPVYSELEGNASSSAPLLDTKDNKIQH